MSIEGGSEHYKSGKVEPLELTEAQDLSFHMGNVVKYVVRAEYYRRNPKLDPDAKEMKSAIDKAIWYLLRYKTLYGIVT